MFADPFSFDVQDAPPVLQMELIDLQCNSELKAKFRESLDHTVQYARRLSMVAQQLLWEMVPFLQSLMVTVVVYVTEKWVRGDRVAKRSHSLSLPER
ncbi:hypothetical protein F2P81_007504 [Scophthalmus maximus]|uniref:Uncharacterized protein n=1 Tax=Scophthalmus maximus TaxID=52904 RepID=A0A6A4T315_SCOMX|nr:hypothetical protein F2P81_007504 [Scophthalmus maximus]